MEVERIDDDKKDRRKWERDSKRQDGIERKGKEQMRKREPTKRRGTTFAPGRTRDDVPIISTELLNLNLTLT